MWRKIGHFGLGNTKIHDCDDGPGRPCSEQFHVWLRSVTVWVRYRTANVFVQSDCNGVFQQSDPKSDQLHFIRNTLPESNDRKHGHPIPCQLRLVWHRCAPDPQSRFARGWATSSWLLHSELLQILRERYRSRSNRRLRYHKWTFYTRYFHKWPESSRRTEPVSQSSCFIDQWRAGTARFDSWDHRFMWNRSTQWQH